MFGTREPKDQMPMSDSFPKAFVPKYAPLQRSMAPLSHHSNLRGYSHNHQRVPMKTPRDFRVQYRKDWWKAELKSTRRMRGQQGYRAER